MAPPSPLLLSAGAIPAFGHRQCYNLHKSTSAHFLGQSHTVENVSLIAANSGLLAVSTRVLVATDGNVPEGVRRRSERLILYFGIIFFTNFILILP